MPPYTIQGRLRPLEPIFKEKKRRGAIKVANTPAVVNNLFFGACVSMGSVPIPTTIGVMFDAQQDVLYVCQFGVTGTGRFINYDISVPSAPTPISGTMTSVTDLNFGVYGDNGICYVTTSVGDALYTIDVDPVTATPAVIDSEAISGGGGGGFLPMLFQGNTWLIDGGSSNSSHTDGRLHIFNVTNPAAIGPNIQFTLPSFTVSPATLRISDTYIIAYSAGRVALVDVSTPNTPSIVTNIAWSSVSSNLTSGEQCALSPSGNYLYRMNSTGGTIDVHDIFGGFALLAAVPVSGGGFSAPRRCASDGRFLLMASTTEIALADVSVELNPQTGVPLARAVTSQGPFLYVNSDLRVGVYADPSAFQFCTYQF